MQLHLIQPKFTYNAFRSENKERIKILKEA